MGTQCAGFTCWWIRPVRPFISWHQIYTYWLDSFHQELLGLLIWYKDVFLLTLTCSSESAHLWISMGGCCKGIKEHLTCIRPPQEFKHSDMWERPTRHKMEIGFQCPPNPNHAVWDKDQRDSVVFRFQTSHLWLRPYVKHQKGKKGALLWGNRPEKDIQTNERGPKSGLWTTYFSLCLLASQSRTQS